ncbi:MAG: tetratricopeptide repeat protein [Ardenticatenales bacterium]|nr:tetratricopeptide repeat protein [Ardenticatenales bacterium]
MADVLGDLEGRLAEAADESARLVALNALAWELKNADPARAAGLADEARTIAVRRDDALGLAFARRTIAACRFLQSDFASVLHELPSIRAAFEALGDRANEASVLNLLGSVHGSLGDYTAALEHFAASLEVATEAGDRRGEAVALGNIGHVRHELGDDEHALDYHLRSLDIKTGLADKPGEAMSLMNIGVAYEALGDLSTALVYHLRALVIRQQLGDRRGEAMSQTVIGELYLKMGDDGSALDYFEESLSIFQSLGDRQWEARALRDLGDLHSRQGDGDAALDHLHQALAIVEDIKAQSRIAELHHDLCALYKARGDHSRALHHHEIFHALSMEVHQAEAERALDHLNVRLKAGLTRGSGSVVAGGPGSGAKAANGAGGSGGSREANGTQRSYGSHDTDGSPGAAAESGDLAALGTTATPPTDPEAAGAHRSRTLEALRREVVKDRLLVESLGVPFVALQADGTIFHCNTPFAAFLGGTVDEIEGRTLAEAAPDLVGTSLADALALALDEGQSVTAEVAVRERWWHLQAYPTTWGGVLGVLEDVTARKATDVERARFTGLLRTAAEAAGRLSAILDPAQLLPETVELLQVRFGLHHVHIYVYEPASRSLVVRAGSGYVGRRLFARGHRISLDAARSLVARAGSRREIVYEPDVRAGELFVANPLLPDTRSELALPLMAHGELVGVLDVQDNEGNRFSQADVDAFSVLASQIAVALDNARLFGELKATSERLREVDQLKSDFLANVSHELRTPLTSILGYVEFILGGYSGAISDEVREDVCAIHESSQQLVGLIDDLVDLARIEAGEMRLDRVAVDLPPLLDAVRTGSAGLLVGRPVSLRIDVEADLPPVGGDALRLKQVFNSLVSNAARFTESGEIAVRAWRLGRDVAISVADTGRGIAADELLLLRDALRRPPPRSAGPTFTHRAHGTGTGLTIAHHLVMLHGGTMDIQSVLGAGTTITVRLPALGVGGEVADSAVDDPHGMASGAMAVGLAGPLAGEDVGGRGAAGTLALF